MACPNPDCSCHTFKPDDGWDEYAMALVGEGENMPREFDDTHDLLTAVRGDASERATRDVVNEDAHVDEEYVHGALQSDIRDHGNAWFGNVKRTYDAYQDLDLERGRHDRVHFDRLMSDAHSHDNALQNVALQAMQNAVENANMLAKQTLAHRDIATSETWSRLETSDLAEGMAQNEIVRTAELDDATLKAIGAAVAAAVVQALAK